MASPFSRGSARLNAKDVANVDDDDSMLSVVRTMFSGPFFVPAIQPIELFFFQRVFHKLCVNRGARQGEAIDPNDIDKEQEIPLVEFQRAMVRLFRVIKDERKFDIMEYDVNKNGKVGWYEFCSLWKERPIVVNLTIAERMYLTLEDAERSILGKLMSMAVFLTILVSTGSFIISTIPDATLQDFCPMPHEAGFDAQCKPTPKAFFKLIDAACAIFFTLEYSLRFILSAWMRTELVDRDKNMMLEWMVNEDIIKVPKALQRVKNFAFNWSNLVDLAAVLPWYLEIASPNNDGNIFIKVIRLTRVVRAFRLGRRFEAVIIIMRSLKKSLRALYVLVLNLFLGMIIFGALMYFVEQGEWDEERQKHVRVVEEYFNTTTHKWEQRTEPSPFESIPACFWWAIVTATTVGYGDESTPKTVGGKVVAGISMVWSLCVLALPIGVIGGNFSQVWTEYDSEKREEEDHRRKEELMLKKSMAFGDPLHYSRRLLLEVWHDSGLPVSGATEWSQSEFMGEVEARIELQPNVAVSKRRVVAPLVMNRDKARRKVSGRLTFEYSWTPTSKSDAEVLLVGKLDVTILKAENLLNIDWKGGVSDPFCIVTAFPFSPIHLDAEIPEVPKRTPTVSDTLYPKWDHTMSWDFLWTHARMDTSVDMSKGPAGGRSNGGSAQPKRSATGVSQVAPGTDSQPPNNRPTPPLQGAGGAAMTNLRPESRLELLRRTVPELQDEIGKLKGVVPHLQAEIRDVRRDVQLILSALKRRDEGGSDAPTAPLGDPPAAARAT
mmetsp:Transcript_66821/g.196143  ORF Transcript_66821/g.196143 Transcript_66821/m.196143 type:complete len:776 (-) Transcript_66821:38-2365(-)